MEEDKQNLFPQEIIMRKQTEQQKRPLEEQQAMNKLFREEEFHLINRIIVADTFSKEESTFSMWELASFHVGSIRADSSGDIKSKWMEVTTTPSLQGLELRYLILRLKEPIYLKSIACEIRISFRLVGESTLWITTRGQTIRDPNSMVCKIRKEQDSQRVFLIFGGHVGVNEEFKFFKKQEFPEIGQVTEELLFEDFIDMKLSVIDNGDDKVFISAAISKKRVVSMSCNKFIPCFEPSHLMIGGSGDSTLLKNVTVREIERVDSNYKRPEHFECCSLF